MESERSNVAEVNALREEIDRLTLRNLTLEREIAALSPKPDDGTFTMAEFLTKLFCHLGRCYGWKDAYFTASKTNGLIAVRAEDMKAWMMAKSVPEWAYHQIDQMNFKKVRVDKARTLWSEDERDYLIDCYKANPNVTNSKLAYVCTVKFRRNITENAIRGALNRVRELGKLPKLRPPKEHKKRIRRAVPQQMIIEAVAY